MLNKLRFLRRRHFFLLCYSIRIVQVVCITSWTTDSNNSIYAWFCWDPSHTMFCVVLLCHLPSTPANVPKEPVLSLLKYVIAPMFPATQVPKFMETGEPLTPSITVHFGVLVFLFFPSIYSYCCDGNIGSSSSMILVCTRYVVCTLVLSALPSEARPVPSSWLGLMFEKSLKNERRNGLPCTGTAAYRVLVQQFLFPDPKISFVLISWIWDDMICSRSTLWWFCSFVVLVSHRFKSLWKSGCGGVLALRNKTCRKKDGAGKAKHIFLCEQP